MGHQTAEVIIWRETAEYKVMTMYFVYGNGLISEVLSNHDGKTTSRAIDSWRFVERVQFAMYSGLEVTFKTIAPDYTTRQHVTFKRELAF